MTLQRTLELYLLEPIEEARHMDDPWQVDGTIVRMIVRATGASAARRLAADAAREAGDLEPGAWLDRLLTRCQRLGEDGERGIIAREVVR